MTKTQRVDRSKVGITREDVVQAAFRVLDQHGLHKLTTRAIAAELDISMNTVLWHIRTKQQLLDTMAEAIVSEVDLNDLHGIPRTQATQLLRRLRQAMLTHRDGAALLAGTFPAEPRTLAFADRLIGILTTGCHNPKTAAWTAWNLFYFTLGLVQEEQAKPAAFHDRLRGNLDADLPALTAALDDFLSTDYDQRFDFGIDQILRSTTQ